MRRIPCRCCGEMFEPNSPNGIYCSDKCRKMVLNRKAHNYYMKKHPESGTFEYVCAECGRKIRVLGRSAHRKKCDECLSKTRYGRHLLYYRFPHPEEVLEV